MTEPKPEIISFCVMCGAPFISHTSKRVTCSRECADARNCKRALENYYNNREARLEYQREYYENNIDKIRQYHDERKEERREYNARRHAENLEVYRKYRADNIDRINAYAQEWRDANKEHISKYNRNYRKSDAGRVANINAGAKRRMAPGTVTKRQWKRVMQAHNYRCAYCGTKDDIEMDHIIPLARGGTNTADNIQPLCGPCNRSKGAKL